MLAKSCPGGGVGMVCTLTRRQDSGPARLPDSKTTPPTWKTILLQPTGTGPTRTESSSWSYCSESAEPT